MFTCKLGEIRELILAVLADHAKGAAVTRAAVTHIAGRRRT